MTQPLLLAMPDSDIAPVTEDAVVNLSNEVKGDFSEFEFCKQATLRGWRARHMGGKEPNYDVIVSRENTRSLFVQVKWAKLADQGGGQWAYKINLKSGNRLYSPFAYDILAAHLHDIDKWVFYARREVGSRQGTWFLPAEARKKAHWFSAPDARDPNNWHLLDEVAAQLSQ